MSFAQTWSSILSFDEKNAKYNSIIFTELAISKLSAQQIA